MPPLEARCMQETEEKPFNDSDDVYDFEYKLQNAISLLERSKISVQDRAKIWEFVELLMALRVVLCKNMRSTL